MNGKNSWFRYLLPGVLAVAAVQYPIACASRKGSEARHPTGNDATAASTLVTAGKSFLPEPAFAYANTGPQAVSIADVAEKCAPSIVNVASSRTIKPSKIFSPFLNDPFFGHFFGPMEQQPGGVEHGLGSGVIVSDDGLVLTNYHVIAKAEELKVSTADRRDFDVKVIGTDQKSDLALLRLKGDIKGLTPLKFGDSSKLRLGDVVLAIGNPFGVGQAVTMGIVSAKGRANVGIADYEDFIQTDAAINPGNSGGALVDMEGELIGINTAILSKSGGSMGIGFAIPSNMAQPIEKALLEHGKVSRGWLGAGIQDVDQDLEQAMKLPTNKAVVITEVKPGGPADKAGLKAGDVVLKMNSMVTASTGELRNAIAQAGAGAEITFDVFRDGKTMTIKAKLGELPESGTAPSESQQEHGTLEGLSLEDLTPALRHRLDLPSSVKSGAVVTGIDPTSAAAESGLQTGDTIVEVSHTEVSGAAAFRQAFSKASSPVLLRIIRNGVSLFLVVKK